MRTLIELREIGVSIALDDFGTGYSSLSYLHHFPVSRIKIDRPFVQRLPDDNSSASIVRAIAQMGESLGLAVTAQGIEPQPGVKRSQDSAAAPSRRGIVRPPDRSRLRRRHGQRGGPIRCPCPRPKHRTGCFMPARRS